MNRVLGLIIARGGSKGIPGKNLRQVAGRPLIAWTIEAAKASRRLDRILLSTDDPEIAEVGRRYGADVPFLRPAELATDRSPIIDAALHALQWVETTENYIPTFGMLLQPTSPLRTAEDIDAAIRMAQEQNADAVVSVAAVERHPFHMKVMDENGKLAPFITTELSDSRRQDLPPVFGLNGAIYLVRRTVLWESKTWCPAGALAYVMPAERSLDVDTSWDLCLADLILGRTS
jgi:CMP-N,N'-diacetyllegionaminic acid synthase